MGLEIIFWVIKWVLILCLSLLGVGTMLGVIFLIAMIVFVIRDKGEERPYCSLLEDDCIHENCETLCNTCSVWKEHNEKEE